MQQQNTHSNEFTILDWVGIIYIVCHFSFLFLFPLFASTFQEIYLDFGGSLPAITELVLHPWFPILLGFFCVGIFSLQWFGPIKHSLKRRRAVIVCSFTLTLSISAFCVIALYKPLFMLAGNV